MVFYSTLLISTTECQFCLVAGFNFNFCKRFLDLDLWGLNRNKCYSLYTGPYFEYEVILQHTVNFHKWMPIFLVSGLNFNFCKRFLDLDWWGLKRNKCYSLFTAPCFEYEVILQHTVNFPKWMPFFGCWFLDLDLWGLNRNKGYSLYTAPCLDHNFILQDTVVNFHN